MDTIVRVRPHGTRIIVVYSAEDIVQPSVRHTEISPLGWRRCCVREINNISAEAIRMIFGRIVLDILWQTFASISHTHTHAFQLRHNVTKTDEIIASLLSALLKQILSKYICAAPPKEWFLLARAPCVSNFPITKQHDECTRTLLCVARKKNLYISKRNNLEQQNNKRAVTAAAAHNPQTQRAPRRNTSKTCHALFAPGIQQISCVCQCARMCFACARLFISRDSSSRGGRRGFL